MTNVHTARAAYVLAYRFIVYGSPAPQGSKKFVGLAKSGRGILTESSKKVKPWRQAVQAVALEARTGLHLEKPFAPMDGPIACRLIFTMPKPASRPKTRKSWCISAPDLSKLARSTEDALTDAGIWKDDSRVCEYLRLAKVFPGEDPDALDTPGCVVEVYRVEAAPERLPRRGTARPAP